MFMSHALLISDEPSRHCLTKDPSGDFLEALLGITKRGTSTSTNDQYVGAHALRVDTYIHIILAEGEREAGLISDGMVAAQVCQSS